MLQLAWLPLHQFGRARQAQLATLTALALLALTMVRASTPLHAQTTTQAPTTVGQAQGVVLAWADARNRGDLAAAAALLADNALFVASGASGPSSLCTPAAPCYDRASIMQYISSEVTRRTCFRVTSIQAAGDLVTGRGEVRSDDLRSSGIERVVIGFLAEVQDGQMAAWFARSDLADPQTALSQAIPAGAAQPGTPISPPTAPCGT